jgi:hypothetical protein
MVFLLRAQQRHAAQTAKTSLPSHVYEAAPMLGAACVESSAFV